MLHVDHNRGNQWQTLFTLRSTDSKDVHRFLNREAVEVWQIFENVCTDLSSSGNGLVSKNAFAESNQRNQKTHRQWNPTKRSTSCLPATGNTHTAWVLWHITLYSTATTLTFSLCNLASELGNFDKKRNNSTQFQFPDCFLAFVLPFSLHKNEFDPCHRWLGNCKFPTYDEAEKGHGILSFGGEANPTF